MVTKVSEKTPEDPMIATMDEESSLHEDNSSNLSSRPETSTSSGDREENAAVVFAQKEARNVLRSKALVFLVLLIAAGLVGFFTYWFLHQEEENKFQSQYHDFQVEIIESANNNAEDFLGKLITLSNTVTSLVIGANLTFPQVTIQNFDILTSEAFELDQHSHHGIERLGPELFLFAPVVPDKDLKAWEEYAVQHQSWLKEDLQLKGIDTDPGDITDEIFAFNFDKESSQFVDFSLPLYQIAPTPKTADIIMLDLYSQASFRRMVDDAQLVRHILLSEVIDDTFFWDEIDIEGSHHRDMNGPRSFAVQPVYDSFSHHSAEIKGFLFAVVGWHSYFADILPHGIEGFVVQVNDTCGSNFAYLLEGPQAIYLGENFQPDAKYDYLSESSDFAAFTRFNETAADTEGEILHCVYTISVHATEAYATSFHTEKPMYLTIVVLTVFLFTALVFVLYDWMVQKRQKKVERMAHKTTAVISSLFPKNVRNRIIADAMEEGSGQKRSRLSTSGKDKLRSFFDGDTGDTEDSGKTGPIFDKPIADFFPDTTIMFADLVGFTAWSSTREPSQVFTLLETIYNDFDKIAKMRKVFKVETVGDCYVAVAGLPDPRKDHAVLMARFARECLLSLQRLTKELEVSLGPDTAELCMRVGLHSGPVTAGVLRGERARFQLFGDTMNTASRMESTGLPNRIHVSSDFVLCLEEQGKSHWVTPRKETIYAKGKGQLQTYFLDFHKDDNNPTSDTTSSNGEGPGSADKVNKPHEEAPMRGLQNQNAENASAAKMERLVEWNVELLTNILKEIVTSRISLDIVPQSDHLLSKLEMQQKVSQVENVISEVQEVITLPEYNGATEIDPTHIILDTKVVDQMRLYVTHIAKLYQDNPFHNFEHASHVTMSVVKLLSRIIAPDKGNLGNKNDAQNLHDHTYGITSDPLTRFSVVLAALIHDADHPGVPNSQLIKEGDTMAELYHNKSIAEQNSVDLAWDLLQEPLFKELRRCIYQTEGEMVRFRQLIVNTVLATDIMDKDSKTLRNNKWDKAFKNMDSTESDRDMVNRKATIVIEHLIQASDVAHTMQHWHIYRKWNEKLFKEMHQAYVEGRAEKDPSEFWYQGEIGFLDFYVIPLAKKLKDCGVFGVSSDEYLQYALNNRKEWEQKGEAVVNDLVLSVSNQEMYAMQHQNERKNSLDALKDQIKEDA